MKNVVLGIVFIVWMIMTLALALSLIGVVVFLGEDDESSWFILGKGLVKKLIE